MTETAEQTTLLLDTVRLIAMHIEEKRLGFIHVLAETNNNTVDVLVYETDYPAWAQSLDLTKVKETRHHGGVKNTTKYLFDAELSGHKFNVITFLHFGTEVE